MQAVEELEGTLARLSAQTAEDQQLIASMVNESTLREDHVVYEAACPVLLLCLLTREYFQTNAGAAQDLRATDRAAGAAAKQITYLSMDTSLHVLCM